MVGRECVSVDPSGRLSDCEQVVTDDELKTICFLCYLRYLLFKIVLNSLALHTSPANEPLEHPMPRLHVAGLLVLILATASTTSALDPLDSREEKTRKQEAKVTSVQSKPEESPATPPRRSPHLSKPRITPVRKEHWSPEQKAILEPLERQKRLYNVFTTMANHPDLARDWLTFANHVLRKCTLPPRDREILILRIGWLCGAEYEWAQHTRIGKAVGLTDDDLKHIQRGPDAAGASQHDRLLLKAVDELRADAFVSDETWNALAKTYDTKQMMDLVFAVGQYNLVSMALNSFGVQLDPGLEGFPK
jgi:alkylhydroperoxidase family enzyme